MRVECDPDAFNDILTYAYTGKVLAIVLIEDVIRSRGGLLTRGRQVEVRPEHAVELLSICIQYQIEGVCPTPVRVGM